MARYYCDVCHLFEDSMARSIYHCPHCGICRVGRGLGQDFFHCPRCDICMAIALKDNHRCVENSLKANCPVCMQYMFTSTKVVVFMVRRRLAGYGHGTWRKPIACLNLCAVFNGSPVATACTTRATPSTRGTTTSAQRASSRYRT